MHRRGRTRRGRRGPGCCLRGGEGEGRRQGNSLRAAVVETGEEATEQMLAESVSPCESGGPRLVRGRTHASVESPSSSVSAAACTAASWAYTRCAEHCKGECQRTRPYERIEAHPSACGVRNVDGRHRAILRELVQDEARLHAVVRVVVEESCACAPIRSRTECARTLHICRGRPCERAE